METFTKQWFAHCYLPRGTIFMQNPQRLLIMPAIIHNTLYSKKELKAINNCRIYLQAITLSTITGRNGLQLSAESYMGKRNPDRCSKWRWPALPSPPKSSWNLWRGALDTTLLRHDRRYLKFPLGPWTRKPHQNWVWFLSASDANHYEM